MAKQGVKENYNIPTLRKAVIKRGGLYSVIAKRLGCDWHTAKKYVEESEEIHRLYLNENESILDLSESKLIENIKDNDNTAILFHLKSKGAERGYSGVNGKPKEEEKKTPLSLIPKLTLATEATQQYLLTVLAVNKNKIVIQRGGTRSSKSYSNAQIAVDWLMTGKLGEVEFEEDFAIVMESLPALRDTIVKDIIEILDNREIEYQHHQSFKYFVTPLSKRRISYFSADKVSKMKRKSGFVWLDEADNIQYEFFQQLMSRVSSGHGLLSFNPSTPEIWINQKLEIERAQIKKDVKVLVSSYLTNPFLSKEQIDEIEYLMSIDPEYKQVYGRGEYGNLTGLIYPVWELFKEMPLNGKYMEVIGLDYGYTDPQAIVRCLINRERREIYIYQEMYESRTSFDDTTNVLKKYPDVAAIVVDNSEPQTTSEYQNIFPEMEATRKYAGSILDGIKTVRKYKIFVHHEAAEIIKENKAYKHAKNKQTSLLLEQPEDANNHSMDAIRYAISWYEAAYGYAYDQ